MKALALFLVLIAFATTGCGTVSDAATEAEMEDNLQPVSETLNDGRDVECIVYSAPSEGGIWCALSEDQE